MDKLEKYRAYAAKCMRQATISATEAERDDWLRIAKSVAPAGSFVCANGGGRRILVAIALAK